MGNNNSIIEKEKKLTQFIQPITDHYKKLNSEVKEGLLNLLETSVQPKEWYDVEKSYDYSAADFDVNSKEFFKITFFPNGTCTTLEGKVEGKENYFDEFGFGVFSSTQDGINVKIVTLGNSKGIKYQEEMNIKLEIREYYFGRLKLKEELISYSELIKDKTAGPFVLKLS